MVFWVTRATENFVCNTFRAMIMANFHLTKKPTLRGISTAGGSCSWTMIRNDDNDENDDDEIAFSLPDRKTGNPYAGEGHEDKPKINYIWTKLLQLCHNLFLVPFLSFLSFTNVLIHDMYSYPDYRGKAKGNETGARIPFRSTTKDHAYIKSLFLYRVRQ